jgi:hypothetical protein
MTIITPYPPIYVPKGKAKPACCPHAGPVKLLNGYGPDAQVERSPKGEKRTGGGGQCWGGGFVDGDPGWVKTPAGWWVRLLGHRPQDLIRLQPHPRVRRWVEVPGASPDQAWQVPVLLERSGRLLRSACDGIWNGKTWSAGDLAGMQESVLAFYNGTPQGHGREDRNRRFRELAVSLLAVSHWIDIDLLVAAGWLGEGLMMRTVVATIDNVGAG